MVGVAGGSKGCANCKKRKIKCDETLPQCLRCIKAHRECGGPLVGPVFRKQRVGCQGKKFVSAFSTQFSASSGERGGGQRSRLVTDEERGMECAVAQNRSRARVLYNSAIQKQLRVLATSSNIPRELAVFPEYDLYAHCIDLFVNNFGNREPSHIIDDLTTATHWMDSLPRFVLSTSPSSTTLAARALVLSHCNALCQDPDIELLAAGWYVEALKYQKGLIGILEQSQLGLVNRAATSPASECRSDLAGGLPGMEALHSWAMTETCPAPKPSRHSILLPENSSILLDLPVVDVSVQSMRGNNMSLDDDTLTASILLVLYEVLHCTDDRSWIGLVGGTAELMRRRDPRIYSSGFNGDIFQSIRGLLAIHSILERKKTFLTSTEWMTVPWLNHPHGKPFQHRLYDLCLQIPEQEEIAAKLLSEPAHGERASGPGGVPRLRNEFQNRESYYQIRAVYRSMLSLEEKFGEWFRDYIRRVKEYSLKVKHYDPNTTEFDFNTGAPVQNFKTCPASTSFDEWRSTHFFKPEIQFVSYPDARVVTSYYSMLTNVIYLQSLTFAFNLMEYEEYMHPTGKYSSEIESQVNHFTRKLSLYSQVVCRSVKYILGRKSNISMVNLVFPLRTAYSVLEDTLEKGWVCDRLRIIHDLGIRISLVNLKGDDSDRFVDEWKLFRSLEVCPGCGEHVRRKVEFSGVAE